MAIINCYRSISFILIHQSPGVIISVGFEDVAAVDDLWHAYERQLLTPCLQEALITEQVLSRTAVTSLKLECRIWEDEIEACREEIKLNKVSPIKLETSSKYVLCNIPYCDGMLSLNCRVCFW